MIRFLFRALAAAGGFWVATRLLHGVRADGVESLILAGLVLGVLNAFLRPVLFILTLPLTIVTLGLFLLVLNGITVSLVPVFIHGVHIHGLWPAILTAVIISVVSWLADLVFGDPGRRD